MQSFNWVDIDGIRYSWDGQGNITCAGQFGYQASIAGIGWMGWRLRMRPVM